MKSIREISLLVLAFIWVIPFTNANPGQDLASFKLKGNVKSVTGHKQGADYQLVFNKAGLLVKEINYSRSGSQKEFIYNSEGLLIRELSSVDSIVYKTEYEYDKSGKLLKTIHFKSDNTIDLIWLFLYSQNGQISDKKGFDHNSILIEHYKYVYDSIGNLYETYMCYNDSINWLLQRNSYNELKRCNKSTRYNSNKMIEWEMKYVYNDEDLKVQQHCYRTDINGNLYMEYMNKYNSNGDLSETIDYFPDGKIKQIRKVDYQYDDSLNYITTNWYENDNLIKTFTRKIEYF